MLIAVGFIAGCINTLAGGGSLLTLPLLIFIGLPPTVANATNRIALFIQNIFAVSGFKSKGVSSFPYSFWLAGSAILGSIIGAKLAVDISDDLFRRILAIVMVMVVILTIFKPHSKKGKEENLSLGKRILGTFIFFFLGIYGGFIQAGVGFLVIATLTMVNNFSLVKTNAIKVFVIMAYSLSAIVVFALEGKVNWQYGLVLAAGNSTGAWIISRWSVKAGDKYIRWFLMIAVIGLAIKLWFF